MFKEKHAALGHAWALAVKIHQPVLVVFTAANVYEVQTDPITAGRHVGTVYPSGYFDNECLKTRWLRWRRCLCE